MRSCPLPTNPAVGARRRSGFATRRALHVLLLLALAAGPASAARAQAAAPDFNAMALDWSRGRWVSPLLCEIGDEPVRGIRRLLIAPGPRQVSPPVNRLTFRPLEADAASRCFTALGAAAPDVVGSLQFRHDRRVSADTLEREFKAALRRDHGFEFKILSGRLRIAEVGKPEEAARTSDFSGGRARFRSVEPSSDAARLLADIESPRKLSLELEAPDGTRIELPLALAGLR